jgi:glycosyltransferase involved in cell wall biosynthesis
MLVSIIISFRNEENNISELVKRIVNSIASLKVKNKSKLELEMIFVNDHSKDDSEFILKKLQKKYPIVIINMARRFGVIPCILAGLAHAKGDCAINIEADLQDPPEIIPQMLEKYLAGAEVVHTTRTKRDGESALKMAITKLAYKSINYFSEISFPENTGNFKLLSRRAIDTILSMPEQDPYFRGISVWIGFKQDFVYFVREPRFSGETQRGLLSGAPAREFVRGLTAFSSKPLFISFFLGLLISLLSLGVIFYALICKFLGIAVPGTAGIIILIAFFGGIILISNGINGLYIAKIYNEVKSRPKYIIDSIQKPSSLQK